MVAALAAGLAGCSNKMLDPGQIGRFRPTPAVNVILDSLGVAEEPAVAWESAEEPRPEDIHAVRTDYVLQPGDVIRVSIFELLQEGVALVNDFMITESGKVSIPELGPIQAAVRLVRGSGRALATAHLRWINPLPANLGEVLAAYDRVIVPEMNLGQLAMMLRATYLVNVESYTKVQGLPLRQSELADNLNAIIDEEAAK